MNRNIIIIILLTTFLSNCSKKDDNRTEYKIPDNAENAAHYYIYAFRALKSMGSYTGSIVNKTIMNGWNSESNSALDYMNNNKKSLYSLQKGFLLKKCDFNIYNKKYSFEQNTNFLKLVDLSDLVFYNIEYELNENNLDKAIELYQGSLDFGKHIAQNKKLLAKMVCITIELNFVQSMNRIFSSNRLDKKYNIIVANKLKDYLDKRFTMMEQVTNEKGFYLEALDYLIGNQMKIQNENVNNKKISQFISEIKFYGEQSANHYFALLTDAANGNDQEKWVKIDLRLKELDKNVDEFIGNIKGIKCISDLINNNPERLKKKFAKQIAELVLKFTIVDFRGFVEKNNRAVKELARLRDTAYQKSL